MKKYLLLVILILIAVMPVFSQAEPCFGGFFGIGGGTDLGFEFLIIGLQFGAELDYPFNFLLEVSGGLGTKLDQIDNVKYFGLYYHLGGLIEYRFVKIILLGIGGGMGGGEFVGAPNSSPYYYPYIRGSVSVSFWDGEIKLGLYYDFCFEYGSMFGFRLLFL